MAKKQKEKPVLNLDGKEYIIEDMTAFMRQQLVECEKVFVDKHQQGVKELKKMLENDHSPHDPGDETD